jgi:prephenate dehydratase
MSESGSGSIERVTFLGPRGTFADSAAQQMASISGLPAEPAASVPAAFEAVRQGTADAALVPIENSVEGSVAVTLDELNSDEPLVILDEVAVPVRFALVAAAPIGLDQVVAVGTHPHAAAQCRDWLAANLPQADVVPTMSTATAAAGVLNASPPYDAAIVAQVATQRYDVSVLADDIGDNRKAWTRFVLVGRSGPPPEPTGCDKTSLVLFMRANKAGALLEILTELAIRGVNLTRLESRPTRRVLGEYCFAIDLEGHVADARVADAMIGLRRVCAVVRYLGSYPRHGATQSPLREGVSDADYAEAKAWFGNLF